MGGKKDGGGAAAAKGGKGPAAQKPALISDFFGLQKGRGRPKIRPAPPGSGRPCSKAGKEKKKEKSRSKLAEKVPLPEKVRAPRARRTVGSLVYENLEKAICGWLAKKRSGVGEVSGA